MQFILTGFTPDARCRVFAFQGIDADQKRTEYTVTADLSAIRLYGILVQELPLLCRALLERRHEEGVSDRALSLSESDMRAQADQRSTIREEAERKKAFRKRPMVATA
jgi:hypothetical protein